MRSVQTSVNNAVSSLAGFAGGDLGDDQLLSFALGLAGAAPLAATVGHLLAEFGDIEIILASAPEELQARGGLTSRAVAVLKLLHAFRADNRRGRLLN